MPNKKQLRKTKSFGSAYAFVFRSAWRYELFFKKVGRVLLAGNSE